MSDALKPCPHCGSATAPVISNCVELESCTNFDECSCELFSCVVCDVHNGGCGASGGFAAGEGKAVEKWNTRAERTCRIDGVRGGGNCGTTTYRLSCGHVAVMPKGVRFGYCPECGAKVEGVDR